MSPFAIPLAAIALVWIVLIVLNERWNLFATDRWLFPGAKWVAYGWLGVLLLGLGTLIVGSALRPPTAGELKHVPFYSLFTLHAILIVFLLGWWILTGCPSLTRFLNIRREQPGTAILSGFAVGFGGWMFTIMMAIIIGSILQAFGAMPKNVQTPMISWMAALPGWKRGMIVLSAATVEEAFFRGWLQKRVGLIASTIIFALAHSGFGQPILLLGVGVISLVIGFTFYRTKNLIPGVIAHGVFDAIQLFVTLPMALKMGMAG
jgi:membrane protease YdiL (CAAX protease family)